MTNLMDLMNKQVKVTFTRIGQSDLVFMGKVVDVAIGNKTSGVWVEHPELHSDNLFVNLSNPNINSIELVPDEIEKYTNQDLKEIKADFFKAIKWVEEDIDVYVKVYDAYEWEQQTYDVEISYWINGEYIDSFNNDTFNGRFEDDTKAKKLAVRRAKTVLRTVKDWFKNNDQVTVHNEIEVYHV